MNRFKWVTFYIYLSVSVVAHSACAHSLDLDPIALQTAAIQQAQRINQVPTELRAQGVELSPEDDASFHALAHKLETESTRPDFGKKVESALQNVGSDLEKLGIDFLKGVGYAGSTAYSLSIAPLLFGKEFTEGLILGHEADKDLQALWSGSAGIATVYFTFSGLGALGYSYGGPVLATGLGIVAVNVILCARHEQTNPSLKRYCGGTSHILSVISGVSERTGEKLGEFIRAGSVDVFKAIFERGRPDTATPTASGISDKPAAVSEMDKEPAKSPIEHPGDLPLTPASRNVVEADLNKIMSKAGFASPSIELNDVYFSNEKNSVSVQCTPTKISLSVSASPAEWSATFYYGLQKLGFLFPHPRVQISPTLNAARSQCGMTFQWNPRLKYRGFHLHTEHPNEWVAGFLQGQSTIAEDTIRWLARNGQNLFEIVLLRSIDLDSYTRNLSPSFSLAKDFGILRGLSVSFELAQQESYRLVEPFYINLSPSEKQLLSSIQKLEKSVDFDFMAADLGTTEFTPTSYDGTLKWIEIARKELEASGKRFFTKNHISTGQSNQQYGNFNLITQFAAPSVGAMPHTVMFYSFNDGYTPVYGNQNFGEMASFLATQTAKRPTWYFPETSYWVGQDIDVPLFLTDYLVARSQDFDLLERVGGTGQIDFTSGQELGYWLMDWTLALLNNRENAGNPLAGLMLLGEDRTVWESILSFQTKHMKDDQLIAILSSSTLLDELFTPFKNPVHARNTLWQLKSQPARLQDEIKRLQSAVSELPNLEGVKNQELKNLLEITHSRIKHALAVRESLAARDSATRTDWLDQAKTIRLDSTQLIQSVIASYNRYPETSIYDWRSNPTSFDFGYLWTAKTLHFWEREESMAKTGNFSAFFDNIYDPLKMLF